MKGLNNFTEFFHGYEDSYVIIGGCACELQFNKLGIDFRVTKDLDLVIIAEAFSVEFVSRFWDYVKYAGYEQKVKDVHNPHCYRFSKPKRVECPVMVELFSRKPDAIVLQKDNHFTPLPVDDDLSSLSAILLDENYYNMILNGCEKIDGIPLLGVPELILFKAKAWLDLTERKANGFSVDSKTIKKHRNDVIRSSQLLSPELKLCIPKEVLKDFNSFLDSAFNDDINLKQLGINVTLDVVKERLASVFEA